MKLAELYTELTTRDGPFQIAMRRTGQTLSHVSMSMDRLAMKAKIALVAGTAAIAGLIKAASDYEETAAKFDTVFKEQTDAANRFVAAYSQEVGRSKLDLKAWMATLQDTFVPLGFARQKAREFSEQLTRLGVDLASFNNMADDEAIQLLTSALVGNHEAVRRFGIVITQTALDQELLAMGFQKTAQGATAQQKALARLNMMMAATQDAQGDATRTAGSFANQFKRLRAEVKDAATELGQIFMPIAAQLVKTVTGLLRPMKEWALQWSDLIVKTTLLTAAVGGLLIVLPKVIAALSFMLAHPLVAFLVAVTAAVTAATVAYGMWGAEIRDVNRSITEGSTAMDRQQEQDSKRLARLQHLLSLQERTNEEQREANAVADHLVRNYGDIGVVFNQAGDAIGLAADATDRMRASMQKLIRLQVERELAEAVREQELAFRDLDDAAKSTFWTLGIVGQDVARNIAERLEFYGGQVDNLKAQLQALDEGEFTPGRQKTLEELEQKSEASRQALTTWAKIEEDLLLSTLSLQDQKIRKLEQEAEARRKAAREALKDEYELAAALTSIMLWEGREREKIAEETAKKEYEARLRKLRELQKAVESQRVEVGFTGIAELGRGLQTAILDKAKEAIQEKQLRELARQSGLLDVLVKEVQKKKDALGSTPEAALSFGVE